jgi:hypothetical protein
MRQLTVATRAFSLDLPLELLEQPGAQLPPKEARVERQRLRPLHLPIGAVRARRARAGQHTMKNIEADLTA